MHSDVYWVEVGHAQRDVSYTDVRRSKIPSTAGAAHDCAVIRHYLNNSHVAVVSPPVVHFAFSIKMLADLAGPNFSVGRLDVRAKAHRLSDYRSMGTIFGQMRMNELCLSCDERCFVELVKTIDFFRMSSVQKL